MHYIIIVVYKAYYIQHLTFIFFTFRKLVSQKSHCFKIMGNKWNIYTQVFESLIPKQKGKSNMLDQTTTALRSRPLN